ncbi:MAG: DUF192 domain-containing protein [Rhizobiaceae bacterium]
MPKTILSLILAAVMAALSSLPVSADAMYLAVDPAPLVARTAYGDVYFAVEVADEPGERERGLMFRDDLPERYGMLFVFPSTGQVGFWMKDTPLALDLVFIGADGVIGAIRRGEPESTTVIAPDMQVRFVLELEAGTALRTGLAPGIRLRHPAIDAVAGR